MTHAHLSAEGVLAIAVATGAPEEVKAIGEALRELVEQGV